jgi:hypothetical protein
LTNKVTNNDLVDTNPQFAIHDGKTQLFFFEDGNIFCGYNFTSFSKQQITRNETVKTFGDQFKVVSDGRNAAILYAEQIPNAGTVLYSSVYNSDKVSWDNYVALYCSDNGFKESCSMSVPTEEYFLQPNELSQRYFDKIKNAEIAYRGRFFDLFAMLSLILLAGFGFAVVFCVAIWIGEGFHASLLALFIQATLIFSAVSGFLILKFKKSHHICIIKYYKDETRTTHIFYFYKRKVCYMNSVLNKTFTIGHRKAANYSSKKGCVLEFWSMHPKAYNFQVKNKENKTVICYDDAKWSVGDGAIETTVMTICAGELVQVSICGNTLFGRVYDYKKTNSENFNVYLPASAKRIFIENQIVIQRNITFG